MRGHLTVLLGFEPALETQVVDELNTSSALADLDQRIDLVELAIPAESTLDRLALGIVVVLLLLLSFLLDNIAWR